MSGLDRMRAAKILLAGASERWAIFVLIASEWEEAVELIVIFTAVTVLGTALSWFGYRAAREAEQTIRLAIEKGVLTDASHIPELREPAGLNWVERLVVLGMLTLFASAGIVLVGLVLAAAAGGVPVPLFALAVFGAALGGGLIACGRWLKHARGQG